MTLLYNRANTVLTGRNLALNWAPCFWNVAGVAIFTWFSRDFIRKEHGLGPTYGIKKKF